MTRQPWLRSGPFDLAFICAPAFVVALLAFLTHGQVSASNLISWLVLVVFVDVAHVHSTLYKTYFDRGELARRPVLYLAVPIAAWAIGVLLYSFGALVFWRGLAYLAVFHFIRQQYGFMRLYSREEKLRTWRRRLDATCVYLAAAVPVLHWHATQPKNFRWFVDRDFVDLSFAAPIIPLAWVVLGLCLATFLFAEVGKWKSGRCFNFPKTAIVLGTLASWSIGIVLFDDDWAFTLTNVVAHGVPYFALIWLSSVKTRTTNSILQPKALWLFLLVPIAFAYFEEGLWDAFVWGEHGRLFPWLSPVAGVIRDKSFSSLLVPLLALPQATHYVLDGFIWRRSSSAPQT